MAEIFISYSREDRDTAHALAVALEAAEIPVWWDRELTGGGDFAAEIERHLRAAPLVIVLWSRASIISGFVRDESSRARDQRKLLPIRIEDVVPPLGFGTLHTLDLLEWDGDPDAEAMHEVLGQVRDRLKQASAAGATRPAPFAAMRRTRSAADPLARRRMQRRWLIGLGVAGVAAAGGIGWTLLADARRERELQQQLARRRVALEHLDKAFGHHFEQDPPDLKKAELEYRLATDEDPMLAEAFFYWGHLTIARMERTRPKPSAAELAGLREDALDRFRRALALPALGRGQRAVADEQIAWLVEAEPAPLERSTDAQAIAALATMQPPPPPPPEPPARPAPEPATRPPGDPGPLGSIADAAGAMLGGLGKGKADTVPAPPPRPPAATRPAPEPEHRRGPPRSATPEDVQQRAEAEAQALFAADRDTRVGAGSVLAGNPQLAAEALPAALAAASKLLADEQLDAAGRAGVDATVQLVANATPAVVQANRKAVAALQRELSDKPGLAADRTPTLLAQALQRSDGVRPAVFIQIAHARQAAIARRLADELEAAGYAAADIETVGERRSPDRPEVRSHGGSDPALARWCQAKLAALAGAAAVLRNLRDARPDNDVFEIWFDVTLCAPGGRQLPGCASA